MGWPACITCIRLLPKTIPRNWKPFCLFQLCLESLLFISPDARLILGDGVLALQDAVNTNAEPRYLNSMMGWCGAVPVISWPQSNAEWRVIFHHIYFWDIKPGVGQIGNSRWLIVHACWFLMIFVSRLRSGTWWEWYDMAFSIPNLLHHCFHVSYYDSLYYILVLCWVYCACFILYFWWFCDIMCVLVCLVIENKISYLISSHLVSKTSTVHIKHWVVEYKRTQCSGGSIRSSHPQAVFRINQQLVIP